MISNFINQHTTMRERESFYLSRYIIPLWNMNWVLFWDVRYNDLCPPAHQLGFELREREREIFIHGKGLVIPDIWKCTSWPTLYKHKTGAYFIGLRANACMVPQLGQCAPNDIQKGHCPLLMWLAARPFLQWTPKSPPFQFLPPLRFCQSS